MTADLGLAAAAYLLGSVPFGLVVARCRGGVNLRQVGSGNIGATNVLRAAGATAAALTLLGDAGKGVLAVGLGRLAGGSPGLLAVLGVAVVLGHLFPLFAGFRGGKGVATGLGAILAAMPLVGALLVGIWLAVAWRWRYSSLAALVAAAAVPGLAWRLDGRPAMVALGGALLVLIVSRHRENIRRLRAGTEGRIGEKARAGAQGTAR
ncbi:MAG TPA: glycerol-3-phosphate 1-O-acyltransferase PlsY [Candidatus Sulfotelmatobacter sp.]|nr:glycerol-3-phosphate 1-O-acyltransferase PlsY [Candidatus Sulfotelmatobacter sp.]